MKPTRRNLLKRILCLPAAVALGASVKAEEPEGVEAPPTIVINHYYSSVVSESQLNDSLLRAITKAKRAGKVRAI